MIFGLPEKMPRPRNVVLPGKRFWDLFVSGDSAVTQARILVVDNSPLVRTVLARYLAQLDYAVTAKDSLGDALSWLQMPGSLPDLIISDAQISSQNHHELIRLVRPDPGDVYPPIILLADKDDITEKIIGFEAGADDYLVKPVSTVELGLRIKAMLARTRAWHPALISGPG
jgi:DNA-binding response OmpR family regulator